MKLERDKIVVESCDFAPSLLYAKFRQNIEKISSTSFENLCIDWIFKLYDQRKLLIQTTTTSVSGCVLCVPLFRKESVDILQSLLNCAVVKGYSTIVIAALFDSSSVPEDAEEFTVDNCFDFGSVKFCRVDVFSEKDCSIPIRYCCGRSGTFMSYCSHFPTAFRNFYWLIAMNHRFPSKNKGNVVSRISMDSWHHIFSFCDSSLYLANNIERIGAALQLTWKSKKTLLYKLAARVGAAHVVPKSRIYRSAVQQTLTPVEFALCHYETARYAKFLSIQAFSETGMLRHSREHTISKSLHVRKAETGDNLSEDLLRRALVLYEMVFEDKHKKIFVFASPEERDFWLGLIRLNAAICAATILAKKPSQQLWM